jgi:hypothetical protein
MADFHATTQRTQREVPMGFLYKSFGAFPVYFVSRGVAENAEPEKPNIFNIIIISRPLKSALSG